MGKTLIIPTNGLVKSRVYEIVERSLSSHPSLDLYLNIALDGQGETHDRIRGVPGHWEKTLDCIEELYPLKGQVQGSVSAKCEHRGMRREL
jgi:MoaA/NifB/PqqE/SkfB family radical SAM enzyme